MRHQHGFKKLGRTGSHRRALLRNLAAALLTHERITTTEGKAKALRPYAERLITLGKRGDLHARRLAARDLPDRDLLRKLFDDVAGRFTTRAGGYTRVLKLGHRRGDCGPTALIELVDRREAAAELVTGDGGGGEVVDAPAAGAAAAEGQTAPSAAPPAAVKTKAKARGEAAAKGESEAGADGDADAEVPPA